jgi:predicted aspartyl protease
VGLFNSKIVVWNPAAGSKEEELELLVETGASYSWFSRTRLESLGVHAAGKMQFRTTDGKTSGTRTGASFVRTDGHIGGDTIVLAEPGDLEVLGAHTLEALGLSVDPVQKGLIPPLG